jgi:hypothetical protein
MEFMSTGSVRNSYKITSKLDPVIRSRLFLYLYKMTQVGLSNSQVETMKQFSSRILESKEEPEEEDEDAEQITDSDSLIGNILLQYKSEELEMNIETAFGFTARNVQQLLLVMYSCMLHNKNEMDPTLSAKQILLKILKMERLKTNSTHMSGDFSQRVRPQSYTYHDWSVGAVKIGSKLFCRRLLTCG